jgi:hypothetical protein
MDPCSVKAITVATGGPSTFVLKNETSGYELSMSSNLLIQQLLLDAYFTGASVSIEYVSGTKVVRRVLPFEVGNGPDVFPPNKYRVSRLATQRMPNGRDEHLEVFLVDGEQPEKPYNIYDPFLQQMLVAAFAQIRVNKDAASLDVQFDGEDIGALRLGETTT